MIQKAGQRFTRIGVCLLVCQFARQSLLIDLSRQDRAAMSAGVGFSMRGLDKDDRGRQGKGPLKAVSSSHCARNGRSGSGASSPFFRNGW